MNECQNWGKRLLMGGKTRRLPIDYQEVEWIRLTRGYGASVAGVNLGLYDLNLEIKFKLKKVENPSRFGVVFGVNAVFLVDYYNTKHYGFSVNNQLLYLQYSQLDETLLAGCEIKLLTSPSGAKLYVNDVLYGEKTGSIENPIDLILYPNKSYIEQVQFWGVTARIPDGEVVCEAIPCYRKSDGQIGMFDTVNNVFRFNNTFSWACGNPV